MNEPRAFSFMEGGPFYRWMLRIGLVRPESRVRGEWIGLAIWLPFVLGEGVLWAMGRDPDPIVFDLSTHVRLLVAMPVLFVAERITDRASRSATRSFYSGRFASAASIDPILDRAERLRDQGWPEAVLAVAALANGQLALWHVGSSGLFHGGAAADPWSVPGLWYGVVALPFAVFVLFRWLFRWSVWCSVLARVALLRVAPIPTHPDLSAGLACLARPLSGFGAFGFALGSVLAAAWGTQMLTQRVTVAEILPSMLVFVGLILAIALLPYLVLCGHLYRARRQGLAQYGDFSNAYTRAFHAKWIASGAGAEQALGTSDLQSLADLGNAYRVIATTRMVVFSARQALSICFGALLPMVPIIASTTTPEDVLKRLVNVVLGGVPF